MKPRLVAFAFAVLVAAAATSGAPARADGLPPATAYDVRVSYKLLATSYYKPVRPAVLFAGALAALAAVAHVRGIALALPDLRNAGEGAGLARLESAIAASARRLHLTTKRASYIAIAGMARSVGDRYTQFFTPDDLKAFKDALDPEKISGIGVIVAPDTASGYIQAAYVMPGTPADRAGLQGGDDIVSVDGISTKGMKQDDVTHVLRGRSGTIAHVLPARAGKDLPMVAIVRAPVSPPTVVYRMLPGDVGYLAVFAFGQETPDQFDAALDKVRAQGARSLVVDLRNNGGGYVDSAVRISQLFIADKPIMTVEQRGLPDQTVRGYDAPVVDLPTAVLVNQYSASASEITAGALQDDGVATLVGARTFGKGVMQDVTPLADGAAIKITIAHYLTPSNRDINLKGIVPDVVVDENKNARFGDPANDAQLRAALAALQKKVALKGP